jgi:GxxExxY protein
MDLDFRAANAGHQPLPDSLNQLSGRVIGCAIEVHRRLGPGLLEHVYDRAMCVELAHCGLKFLRQVATPMVYRDEVVGEFRLDLLVEGELVVEIKSVQHLEDVFVSQVLTYLKATDRRLGLILNFNCSTLRSGIRRVIR